MKKFIGQINGRWPFLALIAVLSITLAGCGEPDMRDLQAFVEATRQASPGQDFEPLPRSEPYEPFTYDAQGLKDPFQLSKFLVDALTRREDPVFDNGLRPDLDRPTEELEKYALGSLKMVGTYRDFNTSDLWALVKAPDGIVHRVREGNHMGQNFGEVFSITEQRIDLQEIVPDVKSGGWKERGAFISLTE